MEKHLEDYTILSDFLIKNGFWHDFKIIFAGDRRHVWFFNHNSVLDLYYKRTNQIIDLVNNIDEFFPLNTDQPVNCRAKKLLANDFLWSSFELVNIPHTHKEVLSWSRCFGISGVFLKKSVPDTSLDYNLLADCKSLSRTFVSSDPSIHLDDIKKKNQDAVVRFRKYSALINSFIESSGIKTVQAIWLPDNEPRFKMFYKYFSLEYMRQYAVVEMIYHHLLFFDRCREMKFSQSEAIRGIMTNIWHQIPSDSFDKALEIFTSVGSREDLQNIDNFVNDYYLYLQSLEYHRDETNFFKI